MNNFCLFVVRAIKVMQESVGNIVFPSNEPLSVLLDACLKEEGGVMMCNIDADS